MREIVLYVDKIMREIMLYADKIMREMMLYMDKNLCLLWKRLKLNILP